jgi:predicted GIY-YIG superfamily endonuclease
MMIAAIIHHRDYVEAQGALAEAQRSTGLRIPVHLNADNARIFNAVVMLLRDATPLSVESIADQVLADYGNVPLDRITRLCSIAPDFEDRTPFAYAKRIDAAAKKQLELGQRVWTQALYRWFDWDDRLLYIGITRDMAARQESHAKASSWSRFAARCSVERYPNRECVEYAERDAIRAEQPLFNHVHNDTPEARQRLVAYLVQHGHLDLLTPVVSRG